MNPSLLQVLPCAPGAFDGVGDYALVLARRLRAEYGIDTVFLPHKMRQEQEIESFPVLPLQPSAKTGDNCKGLVLHYVNYGFQKRGVPFALIPLLRMLRRDCDTGFLVIFHELFASGPPWRSEFWLQSWQKKIARDLARLADARLVSCESMWRQLARLTPDLEAQVQPVTSTWGEPQLEAAQLRDRDPHCWMICGGTALVERSLRSFLAIAQSISAEIAPRKLFVIGGRENTLVPRLLRGAKFQAEYFSGIAPEDAASIFRQAAFAWLDYFSSRNVPADVLLKSSTFAALCAHGVICLAPRGRGRIGIDGDHLPGPFTFARLPSAAAREDVAVATYEWYHRHASSTILARVIAQQLQLA